MIKFKSLDNRIVRNNLMAGVAFGFLFPLLAIIFEISKLGMLFTIQSLVHVHVNNQLLLMIDTAPFFLGLFAYFVGVNQAGLNELNTLLAEQVIIDDLTKINNRMFGKQKLFEMLEESRVSGSKVGVFFIDIDRFKAFNDNLGHWFGDRLLMSFARRLQEGQKDGEFVARLGGDEFLVIVELTAGTRDLEQIAQRYAGLLRHNLVVGDKTYKVNISMGVAVFPDNGDSVETLFKNADVAMYTNKHCKKREYELFHEDLLASINEIFVIEKELQTALTYGELSLVYQPIIDINDHKIVAAEALLRWNNLLLGSVPPAKFIPIAESTNSIVEIGNWVLKEACLQNKRWQEENLQPISVSVNVSANQLIYPDFVQTVRKILSITGLDAQYLSLEITESVSVKNLEEVQNIFRDLREMKVKLAIDDFGTGYSSLSELKSLMIDSIKIDKCFSDDVISGGDTNNAVFYEAILRIAKSLKLSVIAEGIETDEQLQFLKSIHCDYIQGFLFSKPLSVENFARFLFESRKNSVNGIATCPFHMTT